MPEQATPHRRHSHRISHHAAHRPSCRQPNCHRRESEALRHCRSHLQGAKGKPVSTASASSGAGSPPGSRSFSARPQRKHARQPSSAGRPRPHAELRVQRQPPADSARSRLRASLPALKKQACAAWHLRAAPSTDRGAGVCCGRSRPTPPRAWQVPPCCQPPPARESMRSRRAPALAMLRRAAPSSALQPRRYAPRSHVSATKLPPTGAQKVAPPLQLRGAGGGRPGPPPLGPCCLCRSGAAHRSPRLRCRTYRALPRPPLQVRHR
mmetsp:Transcript_127035/g.270917  ORF Transcript_127035/g.270917 Transcript_127035/m.270917 type:complete len:266 (-) Transcript_127035:957-1754(-)